MSPGKQGIPGRKRGTPGNPGYFKMQFLHLRNGLCDKVVLPQGFSSSSRKYRFSINNRKMHVNLDEGTIVISPEAKLEAVQNVALAFVTSMLFLLVQPRPDDTGIEENLQSLKAHPGPQIKPMYMDAGGVAFLMLCGWNIRNQVPTNSTLRHVCGRGRAAGCIA